MAAGGATIIAEATNPADGTIQTATATFNCPLALPNPNGNPPTPGTCIPGTQAPSLLSTLTVYNEGLNTTNWAITGPSATGTPQRPPLRPRLGPQRRNRRLSLRRNLPRWNHGNPHSPSHRRSLRRMVLTTARTPLPSPQPDPIAARSPYPKTTPSESSLTN